MAAGREVLRTASAQPAVPGSGGGAGRLERS